MRYLLFVFFIYMWVDVSAQNKLLTLEAALDSAISNNSVLKQAEAALIQKSLEWKTMTGIEAPEISYFEEGRSRNASQPFDERRWTLSQTIDFPLTTLYRLKAIKQEGLSMELRINSIRNDLVAEVKSRYIDILYAHRLQLLADQQKALADELYRAVYARFETGVGNGIDLAKAELQVAEAENNQAEAERQLHVGRYSLFRCMGMEIKDINYGIEFLDTLNSNEVQVNQITALSVLHEQPDYQVAAAAYDASEYRIKEAKSNLLPDLRFNFYKQNYGDGFKYNGFEIGLSIPIWLPFEQSGKVKMARSYQDEIAWQQRGIEQEMKERIEHAWHSYVASKQIIDRYQMTMSAKSEKLQQLSLEAFRLGEIDLVNLLMAQQTYLDNQRRYLEALHVFYLQLAQLEKYLNIELVY